MIILGFLKKYWVNLIIILLSILAGFLFAGISLPGCSRTFEPIYVKEFTPICNATLNLTKIISESKSKDTQTTALPVPFNDCVEAEKRVELRKDRTDCILEVWGKGTVDWLNLAQKDHYSNCMKDKVK